VAAVVQGQQEVVAEVFLQVLAAAVHILLQPTFR
jgi:hypothetical protein